MKNLDILEPLMMQLQLEEAIEPDIYASVSTVMASILPFLPPEEPTIKER